MTILRYDQRVEPVVGGLVVGDVEPSHVAPNTGGNEETRTSLISSSQAVPIERTGLLPPRCAWSP
jgi:hypothetical protein